MHRYKCTLNMNGTVVVNSEKILSDLEIRDLILKYGFNVIYPYGDISGFHEEGLVEVSKVEHREET